MSALRKAPGLPSSFLSGHLSGFRKDVLKLLLDGAKQCGDVARYRIGPYPVHVINHPELIDYVLIKNRNNFNKDSRSSDNLKLICGNSLLTSNADDWQWRRKAISPLFHKNSIESFLNIIRRRTLIMLDKWEIAVHNHEFVDASNAITNLTYGVIGEYMFGDAFERHSASIKEAVHEMLDYTYKRWGRAINFPANWPTPASSRFQKALKEVDCIVAGIMEDHKNHQCDRLLLIDVLTEAIEHSDGELLLKDEIRKEAITMLIAGHETTANAISWALALTAGDSEYHEALGREGAMLNACDELTMQSLSDLEYADAVFKESIRLYPPIWAMERKALAEDEIGGFRIPKHSSVIISPYVMHRLENYWEQADVFKPERFMNNAEIPRAYMPFGSGVRFCIGRELAMAEGKIILSMIHDRFKFVSINKVLEPQPLITLQIKGGLKLQLLSRN